MKIASGLAATTALLVGTLFVQTASATPVLYCKDGPGIDLVKDGCISGTAEGYPNGGDGVYVNAGGGDSEAAVEAAILGATGMAVDISLYGKSDSDIDLFNNMGVNQNAAQSGTWDLLDDLIGVAYITVKAANSFALYDVGGANSGSWTTDGMLNKGGSQPVVSHISFWLTSMVPPPKEVPEPGSLALLGLGLLGLTKMRRTRSS